MCDAAFDDDRGEVLQRAQEAGISAVIAVGEDLADARRNLSLARRHPMLRPAAGLYPTHLDLAAAERMLDFIQKHHSRLVAIGEVGLDYWKVKAEAQRAVQRNIFMEFIKISRRLNLPLNVHSRSAGRHALRLLLEGDARRVQMHAFDGKASAALPAIEAGFFFSIPPSVVRSRQKQKLVQRLPLEHLLVETDSPVLGPDPGKRNEPAHLSVAVETIAALKKIPPATARAALTANAARLYGDLTAANPPA
jgi:TatD DNase family protein